MNQDDEDRPWAVTWHQFMPWLLLCVLIAAVCGWPGPELMS